jgi:hypothetical protein
VHGVDPRKSQLSHLSAAQSRCNDERGSQDPSRHTLPFSGNGQREMPEARRCQYRAPYRGLARSRRSRWKHGLYSAEALAERKRVRELLTQSRELLKPFASGLIGSATRSELGGSAVGRQPKLGC